MCLFYPKRVITSAMKKFFPVVPRPLAGLVDNRYLSEEEESEAPGDEEMGGEDLEMGGEDLEMGGEEARHSCWWLAE